MPSLLQEPPPGRTPPVRYARQLALAKALAITHGVRHRACVRAERPFRCQTPIWVLGADTIVVAGRQILGKPRSVAEAERMLRRLSGSRHRVITAVALVNALGVRHRNGLSARSPLGCLTPISSAVGTWRVAHATSWVTMRRLSDAELARYARRHLDKAGAYAVQDGADPLVTKIEGSYTNVVGLPQEVVIPLLRWAGRARRR